MNAGQRTWLRWSQVRNPRRINRTAPMVKSPPHHPQPSPRASRPSFRGRDGRRSRKPGARAGRCGQSNGSWASTGPPSGVIWRPEVLQDGSSGWCPIRRHRIPWQRNGVTFSLNTYPDIFPDLRHPLQPGHSYRSAGESGRLLRPSVHPSGGSQAPLPNRAASTSGRINGQQPNRLAAPCNCRFHLGFSLGAEPARSSDVDDLVVGARNLSS